MAVFFPFYRPEDYDRYGRGLAHDDVPMDPNNPEKIGLRPDWGARSDRGNYFIFNLHSLRFAYSLIEPGERGELEALGQARDLFLYWDDCNPAGSIGWHDEHSVSWRSITFAYFWSVWRESTLAAESVTETWKRMAQDHGRHMSRLSNYRPHHNHGLNNALGLVALGTAFHDVLAEGPHWVELGFERAEQQMRDNVSDDGVQLEQSGFYHCYTLRTFLELKRASAITGRNMSTEFCAKLDRMLGFAARIGGRTALSHLLPYSDLRKDPLRVFPLHGEASLPPGLVGPGVELFREVLRGRPATDFFVDEPGGFSILGASAETELSLVFHTRILSGPHAHQDALGLYAALGDRELLLFPSTMFTAERSKTWHRYFIGPAAHNTVQVDSLDQRPTTSLRPGPFAKVADSFKVQRLAAALGLSEALERFRALAKLDHLTLRQRSTARAGEIVDSGSSNVFEFVTARQNCYAGVTHTRSITRVGGRWLVVRDRLSGSTEHDYRQSWHFPPSSRVVLEGSRGVVTLEGGPASGFVQAISGVEATLVIGKPAPDPGGWYATSPDEPIPAPSIRYRTRGRVAEFLWILHAGDEKFGWSVGPGGTEALLREVRLDGSTESFTVVFDDATVRAERSSAN